MYCNLETCSPATTLRPLAPRWGVKDYQRENVELHERALRPELSHKPNLLINEKSPYLREHAYNPVMWRPWGEEAFRKAKNDGKPIFLSIGYSTCHWCHQFARESFEDEKTSALINKNFIPIKVDREEMPEVDAYYMRAVQALTGSGGWPLSVFLTPDLKPFYGGTYFPPEPRYGMPSFRQVLDTVAEMWRERKADVVDNASQLTRAITEELAPKGLQRLDASLLDDGYSSLVSSFDPEWGGFGGPPKFPLPVAGGYLLRYYFRTGKETALRSVRKTLDGMMMGGIRDHLGGGFHRYSTDRTWLVPHFEKMLYDNALLVRLYSEAYQTTGERGYLDVAEECVAWLLGEMRDKEGGFYSAQDADTGEGEGAFYTWTPSEVEHVLGEGDARRFCAAYGVTGSGNHDGRSILHLRQPLQGDAVSGEARLWTSSLYEERRKRPRPATDTKVLTSWNGLAISSLSFVGAVAGNPKHVAAAERAAAFVLDKNQRGGRLLRRFADGESALDGTLDDYAFLAGGLLDLFEASGKPRWLSEALRLSGVMMDLFEDKKAGGLYLTVENVPARLKEGHDGVIPSGNSAAAIVLTRLAEVTGKAELRGAAERILKAFGGEIDRDPGGHAAMLTAFDLLSNGMLAVVVASKTRESGMPLMREVWRPFLPDKVVIPAHTLPFNELAELTGLLDGRRPGVRPTAYVCRNLTCDLPATDPETLRSQLSSGKGHA